jgi:excinuclease ABC subunit C
MSQVEWQIITDFHDAPGTCGVYQYWSLNSLLYIGKAVNLRARLASHAQNAKLDAKEAAIVAADTIRYILCDTEFKALMLRPSSSAKPPHNRAWKDDKSYLYITIDLSDPFPRPQFARAHDLPSTIYHLRSKIYTFGPFPNSKIAEEVLRAIRRLNPFCMTKTIGRRACFYAHLGLCSPCPANIQKLTYPVCDIQKRQYRKQIRQVIKILEGNVEPVIKDLTVKMKEFTQPQDFESALKIRVSIERFTRFITTHSFTDRHFSYNNSSEKLISLQEALTPYLGVSPLSRLECYDASNSMQYDATVSMTVMTDGLLDNGQYRRFRIKNPRANSDFDRLDEALTRRLNNTSWPRPDLIVIDGGVPQLRRLQRIFDKQANPPNYLGLAKHPDRLIFFKTNSFLTLRLSLDHPGLQLLQQLRDEAHRFANSYRKILEKKRQK